MILSEVANLASLIFPHWDLLDEDDEADAEALREVLAAAWRIHNAGYCKPK